MSAWTPPRLLDLAAKSLLRDEALAIGALEYLPTELFAPLFMEAFFGRRRESLKAMVCSWPFTHLPLGALMQMPQYSILQAAFDGLDILLAQKVRPRRWKLQVLDLRNTGQHFWSMWSGAQAQARSPMRPSAVDSCRKKRPSAPLQVFIDLCFSCETQDQLFPYIISWAKRREGLLHLCCRTLKIFAVPLENIEKVLALVQLDCIQEVELNCTWDLTTLAKFAPFLGQMSNVGRLFLSHIRVPTAEENKQKPYISQFTSQFLRLQHLRKLYMKSLSFLKGRLDQLLRCLQTPLETLSVISCHLTESDLRHLSQCPKLSQLKHLHLCGISLAGFSLEPLRALLEEVAATLQDLNLVYCGLVDSQVEVVVPVLSRCRQLRTFSISGNLLSMTTLTNLLRCTAGLRGLSLELYPAPLECYSSERPLDLGRLSQIRAELIGVLRDLGEPRVIWLSTSPCPLCGKISYDAVPMHSMLLD